MTTNVHYIALPSMTLQMSSCWAVHPNSMCPTCSACHEINNFNYVSSAQCLSQNCTWKQNDAKWRRIKFAWASKCCTFHKICNCQILKEYALGITRFVGLRALIGKFQGICWAREASRATTVTATENRCEPCEALNLRRHYVTTNHPQESKKWQILAPFTTRKTPPQTCVPL